MVITSLQQLILRPTTDNLNQSKNVTGKILSLDTSGIHIEVAGQKYTLPLDALVNPELGQLLNFEWTKMSDGKMALKYKPEAMGGNQASRGTQNNPISELQQKDPVPALASKDQSLENILKAQLKTMGLQDTEANLSVIKAQRGFELPMTKTVFTQLKSLHMALASLVEAPAPADLDTWFLEPKALAKYVEGQPATTKVQEVSGEHLKQAQIQSAVQPQTSVQPQTPVQPQSPAPMTSLSQTPPATLQESAIPQPADGQDGANRALDAQPLQVKGALVSSQFSERFHGLLKDALGIPEALDRTLAFMVKHQTPLSGFNVLLTHQMLSGDLGVNAAIFEVLTTEGAQRDAGILAQLKVKFQEMAMPWSKWSEEFSAEVLKDQVQGFSEMSRAIREIEVSSDQHDLYEQVEVLKKAMGSGQESWSQFWIPQPMQKSLQDVEIYIKKDKGNKGKIDPDNALIYISLDTENLGRIRVKITSKKDRIDLNLIFEGQEVKRYFEQYTSQLYSILKRMSQKEIQLTFQDTLENFDDVPNLATMEQVAKDTRQLFDMLI